MVDQITSKIFSGGRLGLHRGQNLLVQKSNQQTRLEERDEIDVMKILKTRVYSLT